MPLSTMSSLMLIIAHISGFICAPSQCRRIYRFTACMLLVSLILLQGTDIVTSPELTLSPASLLLLAAAAAAYLTKSRSGGSDVKLVCISLALSIVFHPISAAMNGDAQLLACGIASTAAYPILKGRGNALLLSAALGTVFFEAEKTLLDLISIGYCCFELSSVSLDRIMVCAVFLSFTAGIADWCSMKRAARLESI